MVTRELFEAMVESYRADPGNHSAAAKAGECDRKTAKKAWFRGWPLRKWPAIRETVLTPEMIEKADQEAFERNQYRQLNAAKRREQGLIEQRLRTERIKRANAELQAAIDLEEKRSRDALEEQARNDAVDARSKETGMVRAQRGNVIALINLVNVNLRMALTQVPVMSQAITTGKHPDTGKKLSLRDRLQIQRDTVKLMESAADATKKVMECERLLLGEPTEIIGLNVRDMSIEEAVHVIDVSDRALERARKRGLVAVPDSASDSDDDQAIADGVA